MACVMSEPGTAAAEAQRRAAYVAALLRHDWNFSFSDDMRVVRAGRQSLATLLLDSAELDVDFVLWDRAAPDGHKRGVQGAV